MTSTHSTKTHGPQGGALPRAASAALLFVLALFAARAESVGLGWNPVPGVAGYYIYFGGASRTYTNRVDALCETTVTISNLVAGVTYYFAATAYDTNDLESALSNEVGYQVGGPIPLQPGQVQVSAPVVFLASTDLVHWVALMVVTNSWVRAATNPAEFYRVQLQPLSIEGGQ